MKNILKIISCIGFGAFAAYILEDSDNYIALAIIIWFCFHSVLLGGAIDWE